MYMMRSAYALRLVGQDLFTLKDALHLSGFSLKTTTMDLIALFKSDTTQVQIRWIDDNSAFAIVTGCTREEGKDLAER